MSDIGERQRCILLERGVIYCGLDLGCYLVDSSVGALCALTTTNPDGNITAKNKIPIVNKQVQEDSDLEWYKNNTAGIGELVHFRATIDIHSGAENYVLHDEMDAGLAFHEVETIW